MEPEVFTLEAAASVTPLYGRVPFRVTALQVMVCAIAGLTIAQAAGQAGAGRIEGQVRLLLLRRARFRRASTRRGA